MRRLAFIIASLLLAFGGLLAISTPAQAAGLSGWRCDQTGPTGNGWKVCVQVHTLAVTGGNVRVDQVQMCAYKLPAQPNLTTGTKSNQAVVHPTGGGSSVYPIPNTGISAGGSCANQAAFTVVSPTSCYQASGIVVLNNWPDDNWNVSGQINGGAC